MGTVENLVLLLFLLTFAAFTSCDTDQFRKCDVHKMNDCPDLTTCTETGECRCWRDYIYNPAHEKNSSAEYCIYKPSQPSSSSSGSLSTTSGSSASATLPVASNSKTASAISQHEPPSAQHLVGGVMIPLMLVLVVLGIVYAVKHSKLIRRAREALTRRNRPFYEDVMMGNDNDDPPLI